MELDIRQCRRHRVEAVGEVATFATTRVLELLCNSKVRDRTSTIPTSGGRQRYHGTILWYHMNDVMWCLVYVTSSLRPNRSCVDRA